MPVSNWIQTEFADRPNFVSDAPDEIARLLSQHLSTQPGIRDRCEYGNIRVDSDAGSRICSYLRFAPAAARSCSYVHAVVSTADGPEVTLAQVEALFHARYGSRPEDRLRDLVAQVAQQPVAQATLALTDLFVSDSDFEATRGSVRPSRSSRVQRRMPSSTLPWLLATAAVGFAGYLLGNPQPAVLAPVGAPPPNLDLAQRIERLEGEQSIVGTSLRGQIEYERQEHKRILEEKERELREFAGQLDTMQVLSEPTGSPLDVAEPVRAPTQNTQPVQIASVEVEALSSRVPSESAVVVPLAVPAPKSAERARVYADLLWVREGPGPKYFRIAALDDGMTVDLTGAVAPGWVEISAPESGWVASDYLQFIEPQSSDTASTLPAGSALGGAVIEDSRAVTSTTDLP